MTDEDKAFLDLAWKMYNEHATQARQHETLRSAIATALLTLSTAVVGFIQYTKKSESLVIDRSLIPVALIFIGAIGLIATLKHYERNRMHVNNMRALASEIDRKLLALNQPALRPITNAARIDHERRYSIFRFIRLWIVWSLVFVLVIGAGFYFSRLG